MRLNSSSITFKKFDIYLLLVWLITAILANYSFGYPLYFLLGTLAIISIGGKFSCFQPGLVVLVFISTFLLYLIPVFFFDIPIASHTEFVDKEFYLRTLKIFIFFLVVLNLFLKKRAYEKIVIKDNITKIRSWPVFLFFYFIQFLIIVSAIKNGNVIIGIDDSYEAYAANIANQNGAWEYFYLFYILAYLFSKMRFTNILLLITFLIYCYVSITRGYRIQMIQMVILFFIFYLDGLVKNIYLISSLLFGLISIEVLGMIKMIGKLDSGKIVEAYSELNGILLTTQTEVFYSTTTVISLADKNIMNLSIQIETFVGFLINLLVPSGLMWDGSRVLDHVWRYAAIGGGGFCFGYAYFWLGYIGIILLTIYIAWLFNSILSKNNLLIIVIILTISVCPRWFAYEPANHLFRLEIWLIIVYTFILLFRKKPNEEQTPGIDN